MIPQVFFVLTLLALPLQGLDLFDVEQVNYIRSNLTVAAGDSVTLPCGPPPPPHIFIWGFTELGPDSSNVAVAYDYGHGPKVLSLSVDLGQLRVPDNTSSLQIEGVRAEAEGMFTCQALYDEEQGVRATFYYTRLIVQDQS